MNPRRQIAIVVKRGDHPTVNPRGWESSSDPILPGLDPHDHLMAGTVTSPQDHASGPDRGRLIRSRAGRRPPAHRPGVVPGGAGKEPCRPGPPGRRTEPAPTKVLFGSAGPPALLPAIRIDPVRDDRRPSGTPPRYARRVGLRDDSADIEPDLTPMGKGTKDRHFLKGHKGKGTKDRHFFVVSSFHGCEAEGTKDRHFFVVSSFHGCEAVCCCRHYACSLSRTGTKDRHFFVVSGRAQRGTKDRHFFVVSKGTKDRHFFKGHKGQALFRCVKLSWLRGCVLLSALCLFFVVSDPRLVNNDPPRLSGHRRPAPSNRQSRKKFPETRINPQKVSHNLCVGNWQHFSCNHENLDPNRPSDSPLDP